MLRLILLCLILTSCTAIDANLEYMPPYTQDQLRQAEALVDEIITLDWFELQDVCNYRVARSGAYGCVKFKNVGRADVYLYKDLSLKSNMDTYNHELGHVYEVLVLRQYANYADSDRSNDHEGWCVRGEYCYVEVGE